MMVKVVMPIGFIPIRSKRAPPGTLPINRANALTEKIAPAPTGESPRAFSRKKGRILIPIANENI